ncbi:hypothetical protein [Candidatus Nitrosocosmicus sp. SS]|jgi:hypothetical protein|uniref:hypothetical protein n=1 Tax=Candidatus Nitrosocosmicus agrestis TaxID=2563600 RepID=UPI00122DC838|nr:hypothetical protein [Candidatus Nitrosocosmicus sp. SS]KAA2280661.1 hypothetical protein F1Z66_10250 [Candidatus Nitrosocosmicus sp. SS]KAF0869356.1 hypothetical protein E5N71_05665 [Candidatus Nitrosocosmicus sp. SS]
MKSKFKKSLLGQVLTVFGVIIMYVLVPTAHAQSNYTIQVSKATEGDFTISDGASYIGTYFDTTYSMTGTADDFINAKSALISTILDDFSKSNTIGYIKTNSTDDLTINNNSTAIANPFASKEQINDKIESVLTYALDKIEHPVGITPPSIGDSREIRCNFSNILNNFWCDIPTFVIK